MSNNDRNRLYSYIVVTLGCGLFSAVYEHFSHQVYSNYMVYLFVIPLLLGVLPQLLLVMLPRLRNASRWQPTLQAFGIATLAVGSALQGIMEIYGTTSRYILYYFVCGLLLITFSFGLWLVTQCRARTTS